MKNISVSLRSKKTAAILLAGVFLTVLLTTISPPSKAAGESVMVENVAATPHNAAALVSWDQAVDSESSAAALTYDIHYGLFSVAEGLADEYDQKVNTASSDTSFALTELTNGVRYYVALKAVFTDGSISSEFSAEVMVTPSSVYSSLEEETHNAVTEDQSAERETSEENAGAKDFMVEEAMALTKNLVKVQFSEAVILPDLFPELSFTVTESDDPTTALGVDSAEFKIDFPDTNEEVVHEDIVFVTLSEDMDPDTQYKITVSAAVVSKDEGSPIESGVNDFADFLGSSLDEIPIDERPLKTEANPEEGTPAVSDSEPDVETENSFILSPETEEPPVADVDPSVPTTDTIAPENATNFSIASVAKATNYLLNMTWKKSISDDVSHQDIYKSVDKGLSWSAPVELGTDAQKHSTTEAPDQELSFKLTATDAAGNENSGVIRSIRLPALPSTGAPVVLIALGAALSFIGTREYRKK